MLCFLLLILLLILLLFVSALFFFYHLFVVAFTVAFLFLTYPGVWVNVLFVFVFFFTFCFLFCFFYIAFVTRCSYCSRTRVCLSAVCVWCVRALTCVCVFVCHEFARECFVCFRFFCFLFLFWFLFSFCFRSALLLLLARLAPSVCGVCVRACGHECVSDRFDCFCFFCFCFGFWFSFFFCFFRFAFVVARCSYYSRARVCLNAVCVWCVCACVPQACMCHDVWVSESFDCFFFFLFLFRFLVFIFVFILLFAFCFVVVRYSYYSHARVYLSAVCVWCVRACVMNARVTVLFVSVFSFLVFCFWFDILVMSLCCVVAFYVVLYCVCGTVLLPSYVVGDAWCVVCSSRARDVFLMCSCSWYGRGVFVMWWPCLWCTRDWCVCGVLVPLVLMILQSWYL